MQKWVRHVERPDAKLLSRDFHSFVTPPAHVSKIQLRQLCATGRRDVALVSSHRAASRRNIRVSYQRILTLASALYFNCLVALDHHSRVALSRIHGLAIKFERSAQSFDHLARKFRVSPVE